MSSNHDATLNRYTGVEQAASIDSLSAEVSEEVGEAISDLDMFQTVVTLNDDRGPFVVGQVDSDDSGYNRLYNAKTAEFAGWLLCSREINFTDGGSESTYTAGFKPASQDEEETVYAVESFETSAYDQMMKLGELLPHIRTKLTGEDWVSEGRTETNYPQWGQAVVSLMDYLKSNGENIEKMDSELLGSTHLEHDIARYPTEAEDLVATAETECMKLDEGLSTATPIGFINFLLSFAEDEVAVVEHSE